MLVHVQILRAVAAGLVLFAHAQHEVSGLAERTGQAFAPSALLPWVAGVDIFFAISGFIIVHAAAPHAAGPNGRARFIAHRVARVAPLYWLVSALYLAAALALPGSVNTGPPDPGWVAASFLFWPAARADGALQPLYGLGWTLNCEMAFYALFAVAIGWGRRAGVAWLLAALGTIVLAGAVFEPKSAPLAFWSRPVMLEFGLGALIALARGEGVGLSRPVRIALALAGLALLGANADPDAFPQDALRPLLIGVPAAMLVAAAALGSPRPAARPSPRLAPLVLVGDASYALYLIHPFVLRGLGAVLVRTGLFPVLGPWPALALMLGVSAAVAVVVHRLVERPMTRFARARLDALAAPSRAKTV